MKESIMEQHTQIAFDWLMLAFITAGIAQGKGRSGFAWFWLSAIFGPLALLVLVMLFSNVYPTNDSTPKKEE